MTQTFASDPVAQLWRTARQWCADTLAALGGPVGVAQAIAREARAAARRRIALLESFVLKLLLIEAARLTPHPFPDRRTLSAEARRAKAEAAGPGLMNTDGSKQDEQAVRDAAKPESMGPAAARRPGNGCEPEDPAIPETWRVRFHTHLAPAKHADDGLARPKLQLRVQPAPADRAHAKAQALARRLEAVRRIVANPHRAIAALARKLAALGPRAHAIARHIALAAPRQGGGPDFADAIVRALDASNHWPLADTS